MRLIQGRNPKLFKACISGVLCIVHCPQVTRKAIQKITSVKGYNIYFWPLSAVCFIKPSREANLLICVRGESKEASVKVGSRDRLFSTVPVRGSLLDW